VHQQQTLAEPVIAVQLLVIHVQHPLATVEVLVVCSAVASSELSRASSDAIPVAVVQQQLQAAVVKSLLLAADVHRNEKSVDRIGSFELMSRSSS